MGRTSQWREGKRGALVALVAGSLSATAFAPLGLWPMMPLALLLLVWLLDPVTKAKRAGLLGWLFGMGHFTVGLNWIATAWTYQAAMPAWVGWAAVPILSFYLAVYPAIATALAWKLGREKPLITLLALAGAWVITEWLRGTMLTGFAWNPIGAAFVDTPWRAAASVIGTYGLSMLMVLLVGAIWLAIKRQQLSSFMMLGVVAAFALFPGPQPAPTSGEQPRITIVQPNIDQSDKWRPGFAAEAARILDELSRTGQQSPRLLFWPEAAVVRPLDDQRPIADFATRFERARAVQPINPGDWLVTGGIALQSDDGQTVDAATNSVFILGRDAEIEARYDKAHLLPWGEYLPMRGLLEPFGLARLAPGAFDFSAGPGPMTYELPGFGKMGVQICYEIVFPGRVIDPDNRPEFIFNPSNDAWFGAWGPPQHLAQARLRAVEEGLPIIRSTPTGISAVIDSKGAVRGSIPWRQAGAIDTVLPAAAATTVFADYGRNLIPLLLALALMAVALVRRAR